MNQLGTIRRIDELGRIVIPKVIRSKMRITEGDRLEIVYNNEMDSIMVVKHNAFHSANDNLQRVLDSLEHEVHHPLMVVTNSNVLLLSKDNRTAVEIGENLSQVVLENLSARKTSFLKKESITENGAAYSFVIYPLAYNSEILGGVLVATENPLTPEENRVMLAFRNLITNFIKD